MTLETPVKNLAGIGPVFQKKLKKMGIETIEDLLFHFPTRYEDFSKIKPIAQIKLGERVCLTGRIKQIKGSKTYIKKWSLTEAIIEDKSGAIKIIWFRQPYLINSLKENDFISLVGKAHSDKHGFYISNPVYEKLPFSRLKPTTLTHTGRIVPIYPETAGLSSRWLRNITKPLLSEFKNKIPEILPEKIMKKFNLPPLEKALWQAHFPDSLEKAERAKERFSFQELFIIELSVLKRRFELDKEKSPALSLKINLIKKFVKSLPFKLTDSQRKCAWQILKDLEKSRPMSRLLQGDVGSGKTVVAIMAALNCVKNGYQVAFMSPTEILAKQHFYEAEKLLRGLKIGIALLTGKEDKIISKKLAGETIEISRQKILEKTQQGKIDILIGTHALIQDKVNFKNLAFCIVDEQHRFGVEQRSKLIRNSQLSIPHLLSMTATPIPRSLALTIYGDLDLSILDQMPKGRKKIITEVIPPAKRKETYNFIKQRVKKGEQVFVICPRIEPSQISQENLTEEKSTWSDVKAVKEEYEKLSKEIFPDLKVAMLHGKMKVKEKEKIMKNFKNKKIDILVSTSVVEVGIDIPGATIMMIEGAERFGLAQLHQFRGRVGRSNKQSYCFLFTDSPAKKTHQRLKAIIKAKDGFELAEKDLQIRGPGSLTGIKQWGIPDLAMENLKNLPLVEKTRESAKEILSQDINLKKYPFLEEKIKKFKKKSHLE